MSILILRVLCAHFVAIWLFCVAYMLGRFAVKAKGDFFTVLLASFLVLTKNRREKLNKFMKGELILS